jgi:predicted nucleic acid-binding protein
LRRLVCNTSPLQYLHQIGQLGILPRLAEEIIVPQAVVNELAAGRQAGVELPEVDTLA